jgi:hypothetical protein
VCLKCDDDITASPNNSHVNILWGNSGQDASSAPVIWEQ